MGAIFGVLAGSGLLIAGIHIMRYGLQQVFGRALEKMLRAATNTPTRGLIAGVIAAALLQSSTAVSLITIGLVGGACLSFRQGLGIILGANIGTCITVQLMSLSLPVRYLVPLLLIMATLSIVKKVRSEALAITGLVSMFVGLNIITESISVFTQTERLLQYIDYARIMPAFGILVGVLMTFVFQSSSAATTSLMTMVQSGMVDSVVSTYIVYGNNVGSCLSSLVVSAAAPLAARRIAIAHIVLNVLGVAMFLPFTHWLIAAAVWLTNDEASQIAMIHTLFNLISSLAVLPVVDRFAQVIEWLAPERQSV